MKEWLRGVAEDREFGYYRTKGVFIIFIIVNNNVRTLSTLNAFIFQNMNGKETALHPRHCAEKANTAHLDIVSVKYGPSTELARFIPRKETRSLLIACEGHTSQGKDFAQRR